MPSNRFIRRYFQIYPAVISIDAEETHAMLNNFFAAVDIIVHGYGRMVDKHIGDAVMAVFGAPVALTDDPERALRAAGEIHDAVGRLSPPLKVHIGVDSGQVVASSTGGAAHMEYTMTGDSVNPATRLTD
ncbi:MAG: adenylate/guanylate cyclase domain-containing protein, partial [Alphaproteobacteria bacterium]